MKKSLAKILMVAVLAGCSSAKPKSYTVTLDANGGEFASGEQYYYVTVENGQKFENKETPECVGYDFQGWYINDNLTERFQGMVSNDMTVYAKWSQKEYDVSFIVDDEAIDTVKIAYGGTAQEPETEPTKDNMHFTGWFTNETLETPFDFSTPITENTKVYAGFGATFVDLTELDSYVFQSQVRDPYVWMGCETASLMIALKTTGHIRDMSYTELLKELPMTDSDNPYLGFCGDLYSDTWTRDAVMPNIITEWGAQYGNTKDLTKTGLDPVITALENGHPVVVWTSSKMVASETVWDDTKTGLTDDAVDPLTGEVLNYFGSTGSHWEYKTHNHVMTLVGYNSETQEFKLADPAEWLGPEYWVSYDTFMKSWDCYQGAVEVW